MVNKRREGAFFEEAAARHLTEQGYLILERNYKRKTGEIDLIAAGEAHIIFIEVKYRRNRLSGAPEEAVTPLKQQRILRTAAWYMKEHHLSPDTPCRFDVIAVEGERGEEIRHLKNAFGGM